MRASTWQNLRLISGIPTAAEVGLRAIELDSAARSPGNDSAELLASDPGLACATLRFANLKRLETAGEVTTVRDALGLFGARALRVVALSHLLSSTASPPIASRVRAISERSARRGRVARSISRAFGLERAEEAFQAAVLAESAELASISADRGDGPSDDPHPESAMTRSAVLLRSWRVPRRLCIPLAQAGHRPLRRVSGEDAETRAMASILRLAWRATGSERVSADAIDEVAQQAQRELALSEVATRSLIVELRAEIAPADGAIDRVVFEQFDLDEIFSRARATLVRESLEIQVENGLMKRREEQLLMRVTTDGLTGVKNRLAFDERLGEEFERAERASKPMTLLLCDLDRFKSFNDRYGHLAGDAMLRAAAGAIAQAARRIDVVARYGGEEFAVIAPHCGHVGARALAERIRRAVEALRVPWKEHTLSTTISIGGAVIHGPRPGRNPTELIQAADGLLYAAKESGRNRCLIESDSVLAVET